MALVSVVVTVRNEAARIEGLLTSLEGQNLHEVILVDAASSDGTVAAARRFESQLPLRILVVACSRGAGRNLGAARATGDLLAFIDGDCRAQPGWAAALASAWGGDANRVVAGATEVAGPNRYARLHRVELPHRGQDTTWPSCNLAYPRALFAKLGGFDEAFVTAEDIDLNFRAVDAGARILHAPAARVEAQARSNLLAFLRQAYWNGFGRKQLTLKHGRLWQDYRFRRLLTPKDLTPVALLRLAAGLVGYLDAKLGRPAPAQTSTAASPEAAP
ncbi:MAG: glycosyltransferase [Candidatus Thermoplasmatota archaeon]